MARHCEDVLATTHTVYMYACMYMYMTSNGNSLVRLCPARKKEENKERGLDSSSSVCRVSSTKSKRMSINIMRLWTAAWQYRGPWAHIYIYVYVCTHTVTPALWDTRSRVIPMLGQSVNGCRFVCTLRLWHGLASPVLSWPGLDHVWLWAF